MADGILEGFLGSGEDSGGSADARDAAPPDRRSDQLALSMAIELARINPEVARHTARFMEAQAEVARAQATFSTLGAAHAARELQAQSREGWLRRAGQRARLAMQVFAVLVASTVTLALLSMLYAAATSRSVIVDLFRAPSSLAATGLTGDVIATKVLDALQKLQDDTRSDGGGALETHGAWASDIKLDLPETGVSVGEIDRILHREFGHDTHIDGDVVQTGSGALEMTIRGDGVPAASFAGPDLGALVTQGAEYAYSRSQPGRYASYLISRGRLDDALAFVPGAFSRARNDAPRGYLALEWGTALTQAGRAAEAKAKWHLALSLVPRWSPVWWLAMNNLIEPFHGEEVAWRASRDFLDAWAAAPAAKRPPVRDLANVAESVWDMPLYRDALADDLAASNDAGGTVFGTAEPTIADVARLMHDPEQVERAMAGSDPGAAQTRAEADILQGVAALDRGDPAGAIGPLEHFQAAWLASTDLQLIFSDQPCFLGLAYGLAGRLADADAVFDRTGAWSRCWAYRGDVRAATGDVAGARRAWADGIGLLPDLPLVYLHRGLFEFAQGDLKPAEADLAMASAKAPHFADPLKAWGDLLAREGRWREAVAKYDQALRAAPAWAELHQARDTAARKR